MKYLYPLYWDSQYYEGYLFSFIILTDKELNETELYKEIKERCEEYLLSSSILDGLIDEYEWLLSEDGGYSKDDPMLGALLKEYLMDYLFTKDFIPKFMEIIESIPNIRRVHNSYISVYEILEEFEDDRLIKVKDELEYSTLIEELIEDVFKEVFNNESYQV